MLRRGTGWLRKSLRRTKGVWTPEKIWKKRRSILEKVVELSSSANHFHTEAKGCDGSYADIEFGASSLNLLRVQQGNGTSNCFVQ